MISMFEQDIAEHIDQRIFIVHFLTFFPKHELVHKREDLLWANCILYCELQ